MDPLLTVRRAPTTRRARLGTSLAAAAVLALGLASCGGDEPAGGQASASASAEASSTPSASATISDGADTAQGSGDEAARTEYVEAVREAAQETDVSVRSRITSTVSSGQQEIETVITGVTAIEDGELTADFDTTLPESQGGAELRTVIVDGVLYVQAPGVPEGKFQRIDIDEAGGQFGEQLQQQLDQLDPRAQGAASLDAITSVERVGESTVDGVDVTDYRVVLDFAGYAEAQGNQTLLQLQQAAGAPDTVPALNSLDDEGRIRRSVIDLELQGTEVRTVADFLEYGVDVDVTAPPRSRTVEAPTGQAPTG